MIEGNDLKGIEMELVGIESNLELIADQLRSGLISPNVQDSNSEPANLVDVFNRMANCINHHASAVERVAVAIENLSRGEK